MHWACEKGLGPRPQFWWIFLENPPGHFLADFLHLKINPTPSKPRACLLSLFLFDNCSFSCLSPVLSSFHWLVSFGLDWSLVLKHPIWWPADFTPKSGLKVKSFKRSSILCLKLFWMHMKASKPIFREKLVGFKAQAHLFTFAQLKYFLLTESAEIQWSFIKSLELVLCISSKLIELYLCPRVCG